MTLEHFFKNTNINKPLEDIWSEIDQYTDEVYVDSTIEIKQKLSTADILLPPLRDGDKIIKGLIGSRAVDYLYSFFPNLGNYFFTIANSMCEAFPKSEKADAYFMLYDYPKRAEWFRKTYPNRADKILIPYQDADYTNEYTMLPIDLERDIDVFMTARMKKVKNLDIFLKALMYVEEKYGKKLNAVLLSADAGKVTLDNEVYAELVEITGSEERLKEFIKIEPNTDYSSLLLYYSRAKLTALTSLFEGKNRSIQESVLCNTPVICFSALNQYIKGENSLLPNGCAYYVDQFTPEAFGKKLYELISQNKINYNTRDLALKHFGRKLIIDKIIKIFPYYREQIPNLMETNICDNDYINELMSKQFGLTYEDWLYKNSLLSKPVHEKHNTVLFAYTAIMHYCKIN